MTGMRRNENQPPKGLQCEWCCAIRVWLTYLQGKVTTQQCCVGKNWVIKFPPFPESVPEEYLFSECNPDFSASNKTQMKLFWGGASQQCQPYSSSLVQRQQRSICVSHRHIGTHTYTYILFILGKHWKYTYFFSFLEHQPKSATDTLFTLFLICTF